MVDKISFYAACLISLGVSFLIFVAFANLDGLVRLTARIPHLYY